MPRWITVPYRKGEVTVLPDEQPGNEYTDPEFAERLQQRINSDVVALRHGKVEAQHILVGSTIVS